MTAAGRIRWAVVSGIAAFAAALYWRHFGIARSLIVGAAVGVLVQMSLNTAVRLRELYRRD